MLKYFNVFIDKPDFWFTIYLLIVDPCSMEARVVNVRLAQSVDSHESSHLNRFVLSCLYCEQWPGGERSQTPWQRSPWGHHSPGWLWGDPPPSQCTGQWRSPWLFEQLDTVLYYFCKTFYLPSPLKIDLKVRHNLTSLIKVVVIGGLLLSSRPVSEVCCMLYECNIC